jgi:hypothetical protein
MHLAAISNDPMGDLDPEITRSINARGSIALARAAKTAGVPRFLFSSSCSIYGQAEGRPLAEEDALNPVSVYADRKSRPRKASPRWPTPTSRWPICATRRPMATRRCCALISSSTTCSAVPSPKATSGS